ncbi:MAG: energy transducer TonB, partial [Pseudomonadota bacterium]|nr:energy transducer TonB [Pseudomonadota bacterium]
MDVTEIVAAKQAFSAQANEDTRAALFDALAAYDGDATVESVNAYMALLLHDATGDSIEDMYQSATAATAHFEPVSDILPKHYLEARFMAAVGLFNVEHAPEAMEEMAHVRGRAQSFEDATGERPAWATSLRWKADAWEMAMEAYFLSADEPYPSDSDIQSILASYGVDTATANARADRSVAERGLPFCSGKLVQRPKLRYPIGGVRRGMYGAVILGLELDEEGNVIDREILASVPENQFDKKSLRVVKKWKYRATDENAVGVTCRLNRKNLVLPLTF